MHKRFLLASGIMLSLALVVPGVNAQACVRVEDFEGDQLSVDPTGCWYSTAATGGDNYVVSTPAQGTRALSIGNVAANAAVDFATTNSYNWCVHGGASLSWQMRATSLGTAQGGSGTGGGATNTVKLGYDGSNVVLNGLDNSGAAYSANVVPAFTWAVNTWYNLTITLSDAPTDSIDYSCTTGGPSRICGTITTTGGGSPSSVCVDKTFNGAASTNFQHVVVAGNAAIIYLDGFELLPEDTDNSGSRFCANVLDEPEFGYEYTDGLRSIAEAEDDGDVGADLSMDDGFFFSGSDEFNSWDMTAKHFTTGSKAFHVFFQIEAATDATDSTFRVAFTLNNAAVPDGTNRGNGLDTLLFDDQYEVQFRENGNDWQIQLFKAEAGGSRASQGPATNFGNPNNPEVYSFWLDTRAANNYAAVKNSEGVDIINTTSASVPNLPASFAEDTIYDQWFLGYGSGVVGGVDINQVADTELNDNKAEGEDSGNSTCIYDDVGTSIVGSGGSGTSPGSDNPTEPPGGGDDGLGDAFCDLVPSDCANNPLAGGILASIFWILVFAAGAYGIFGKSLAGLGLGALLGFAYSVFTGLMPGIVTFLIVTVALALLGMRLFQGGQSSEGM